MSNDLDILKTKIYDFLIEKEIYIYELSNIDLFNLFFGLRPSVLLNKIFAKEDSNINQFIHYLCDVGIVYNRVRKYIMD